MQIPVDAIDIISGQRDVPLEKLDLMTLSIKAHGVINRPTVMENSQVPNRYTMIAGRNRLTCVKNLGWEMIDVSVVTVSEAEAQMVECAENLCRINYSAVERDAAMSRYVKLYAAAHPEVKEYLEQSKKASSNLKQNAGTKTTESPQEKPGPTPIEAAATKFGKSKKTIQNAITRAQAFTDEQKLVLKDRKLSRDRLDALAKAEPVDRVTAINLLAAGMAYPEAMKETLGERYADDGDEDQVDDETFLNSCPVRAKSGTNKARFDADALFYREIQQARIAFAKTIGWGAKKARVGEMGAYARRLMLFMDAKHPRDWLSCGRCVKGINQDKVECSNCKGGGYVLG